MSKTHAPIDEQDKAPQQVIFTIGGNMETKSSDQGEDQRRRDSKIMNYDTTTWIRPGREEAASWFATESGTILGLRDTYQLCAQLDTQSLAS